MDPAAAVDTERLRTHLTTIELAAEMLLRKTALTPQQRRLVERIVEANERCAALVAGEPATAVAASPERGQLA